MELDNMKELWKDQQDAGQKPLSEQELITMIGNPSKGPIAKMKRNLKKELIFVLVTLPGTAIYFQFHFNGKMFAFSITYILMTLVFVAYYYFKNKLLNNMQCVTCEVKSNLTMQANTLEKYLKNNLIVSTFILPVIVLFGMWLLYLNYYSATPKSIFSFSVAYSPWITTLIWTGISIAITIPMYFLNKKYLHWLYGKHINRLKSVLSELDSE